MTTPSFPRAKAPYEGPRRCRWRETRGRARPRRSRAERTTSERPREVAPLRAAIDELDLDGCDVTREVGDERAEHAGADDAHAIAEPGQPSQTAFTAVSRFAASTARSGVTPGGRGTTSAAGTT